MIIQNAIKIIESKEPTYLVSAHRHDFVTYSFSDSCSISVDGGKDYLRRCGNFSDVGKLYIEWSLTNKNTFKTICNRLLWGTRGKDGDEEFKYVLLKDCSKTHLRAILKTQDQIKGTIYEKVIRFWLKKAS